MKLLFTSLVVCSAISHAATSPVNAGFEDPSVPFPIGWNPSGTVVQVTGLGSPVAASLAAGAAIFQDFAPNSGDGLVTFTTSFSLRLAGSGTISTDTSRVRIRGNGDASNLITLRLTSSGLQCFNNGTWNAIIPSQQIRHSLLD